MPVSYDHIGRDIIIVAVMFLLVFAVFTSVLGFALFLAKSYSSVVAATSLRN